MYKKEKYGVTELSKKDRKVLDKYTKSYSNFIESSTAKTGILQEKVSKLKAD
ncbi:hypothetical protein [Acetivibrio mesophilus]|uniref:hypothetical protein n=1 Tax=Acetivibrio mesophilus TaxID=2487273 RepID=UPI0014778623|nr:hypothetical protein [Acetivibrio mesophilus]HHV29937.1 hypothetical protein [Clostridium sp.]